MKVLAAADVEQLRYFCERDEFFWLDLLDPDQQTVEEIGEILNLHPLAIEDSQKFGQRPKLDSYGAQLLLVYYGAACDDEALPELIEVHIHISGSFVLTVHRDRCRQFENAQQLLERRPAPNEQVLVYRVIDSLTDSVLEVLESVTGRVDEWEAQVFHRPRARDRDDMARLRRSLAALRRVLVTQRQAYERLVERIVDIPGLEQDVSNYYRDVEDHLWRAVDETEAARESLQGMLETYTNEVQERLTIVATIFLPLTVVTGFFGMNFGWMVKHIGAGWTFWGLGLGGMVLCIAVIVLWLVRSGLLQRRR